MAASELDHSIRRAVQAHDLALSIAQRHLMPLDQNYYDLLFRDLNLTQSRTGLLAYGTVATYTLYLHTSSSRQARG